jgi:hypothetical protein
VRESDSTAAAGQTNTAPALEGRQAVVEPDSAAQVGRAANSGGPGVPPGKARSGPPAPLPAGGQGAGGAGGPEKLEFQGAGGPLAAPLRTPCCHVTLTIPTRFSLRLHAMPRKLPAVGPPG